MKAELLHDMASELFGDLTDAMEQCRDHVLAQVIREFANETDPWGIPWEPWYWTSDYPVEEHKTLQHTGALFASFVSDQAGHVEEITKNEMVFGSSVVYAMNHQEGGKTTLKVDLYGRHGGFLKAGTEIELPARPIVGWPDDTVALCESSIVDVVLEGWYEL